MFDAATCGNSDAHTASSVGSQSIEDEEAS